MEDKVQEIYVIYSNYPIDDLREFLEQCTNNKNDIGIMRLDHFRGEEGKNKESNRTIVSLNPDLYKHLESLGYSEDTEYDFKIKPYEIRRNNHPPEDCNYNIYIVLPLGVLEFEECQIQLTKKLSIFEENNILKKADYKIFFSNHLKEKPYVILYFSEKYLETPNNVIKLKILLDQTKWWKDENDYILRASWCKNKTIENKIDFIKKL